MLRVSAAVLAGALALGLCAPASAAGRADAEIAPKVFVPSLADQPDRQVLTGRFEIAYRPIMCIRAPCAAGTYTILRAGRRMAVVRVVVVEARGRLGRMAGSYKGRCLPFRDVEGSIRIELGTAFLRMAHMTRRGQPC